MACGPSGREGTCISGTPAFFGTIFNSFPQERTCLNGGPLAGASPVDLAVSMQTSDPAKGGAHPAPVALGLGGLFCVCPPGSGVSRCVSKAAGARRHHLGVLPVHLAFCGLSLRHSCSPGYLLPSFCLDGASLEKPSWAHCFSTA